VWAEEGLVREGDRPRPQYITSIRQPGQSKFHPHPHLSIREMALRRISQQDTLWWAGCAKLNPRYPLMDGAITDRHDHGMMATSVYDGPALLNIHVNTIAGGLVGPRARTYAHSRPAPSASEPRPGSNTLDIQMQYVQALRTERFAMGGSSANRKWPLLLRADNTTAHIQRHSFGTVSLKKAAIPTHLNPPARLAIESLEFVHVTGPDDRRMGVQPAMGAGPIGRITQHSAGYRHYQVRMTQTTSARHWLAVTRTLAATRNLKQSTHGEIWFAHGRGSSCRT
jgi:hypothetical protein